MKYSRLVAVLEKTLGYRLAVSMLLAVPLLPKRWFLGTKFRYFNRYNKSEERLKYMRALLSKPRDSLAFEIGTIMSCYAPEFQRDAAVSAQVISLKRVLLEYRPTRRRDALKKIHSLIKCFDFLAARDAFSESSHLLQPKEYQTLISYFETIDGLVGLCNPLLEAGWSNTVYGHSYKAGDPKGVVFFFPPALVRLEIVDPNLPLYFEIARFFQKLLQSAQSQDMEIIPKLQFAWRDIFEQSSGHIVVSYHTHGDPGNNLRVKEAPLANLFTIDSSGFSGWHSLSSLTTSQFSELMRDVGDEEIESTYQNLYEEYVLRNVSKYKQSEVAECNYFDGEPYFFLCLQVVNDIVSELAYMNVTELLKSVVSIAVENGLNVVVKRHPMCQSAKVSTLLSSLHRHANVILSKDSIHAILPGASALITVNSGVGIEALLHQKRIVCTGVTEYSLVAETARNRFELEGALLSEVHKTSPTMIKAFLYYYRQKQLFHYSENERLQALWR